MPMARFLKLKLKNVTKMRKIIIIAILLISTNCFSQTLNDTIPYLKSKILPNISLYQDKPLSTLLDNIPYLIKGYNTRGGDEKYPFTDTELKGVVLYLSPKLSVISLFNKDARLNYSPKTITVYFKNISNLPKCYDGSFLKSPDDNNWDDYIKNEFRKPIYIVDRIEFEDVKF
jgi:hypothetical protein